MFTMVIGLIAPVHTQFVSNKSNLVMQTSFILGA